MGIKLGITVLNFCWLKYTGTVSLMICKTLKSFLKNLLVWDFFFYTFLFQNEQKPKTNENQVKLSRVATCKLSNFPQSDLSWTEVQRETWLRFYVLLLLIA